MIYLYSGTPGSGKSLHATADIKKKLRSGGNVIANFPVKIEKIHGCKGKFYFVPDEELTVQYLCRFALKNHHKGKEKQTLIVIDEASRLFNPRDFARPDRMQWNKFMALHRHLGFSLILVSQSDRLLDKQIRYQIEFDVKHRAANNFKTFGWLLGLLRIRFFVAVYYWYAVHGEKDHLELIRFSRKTAELYDSYALFDVGKVNEIVAEKQRPQVRGQGVPGSAAPAASEKQITAADIQTIIQQQLKAVTHDQIPDHAAAAQSCVTTTGENPVTQSSGSTSGPGAPDCVTDTGKTTGAA